MATFKSRRSSGSGKRWQWTVRIKGFPPQYGTCPTKECARQCAKEAEEQLRAGRRTVRVTLAELLALYAERYLPTIADSAALYTRHVEFWKEELGRHFADAITSKAIGAVKMELASRTSRFDRPLSAASVNRYLTTLSSVYTWGMSPEVGLVDHNPVRDVVRLKEPRKRVRWLSRPVDEESSELERLLKACEKSRSRYLKDLVLLYVSTGCRESEILEMEWSWVRLTEGGFAIPAEVAKTEEPRFVPLEGLGLEVIERRMSTRRRRARYVFPSRDGKSPASFPWSAWRVALSRAGISNLRPHDLRHTLGSYLAMMGKTLPEIKEALGHKSDSAALRYIHLADSHKRAVSAEVNGAMASWLNR